MKQEQIGKATRFNRRYHGDFFPSPRTRYSISYLNKKASHQGTKPEVLLESDHGIFVTNKCNDDSQGISILKDYLTI